MSTGHLGATRSPTSEIPGRVARGEIRPSRDECRAWRRLAWTDVETGERLEVDLHGTNSFFEALDAAGCEHIPAEDRAPSSAEPTP